MTKTYTKHNKKFSEAGIVLSISEQYNAYIRLMVVLYQVMNHFCSQNKKKLLSKMKNKQQ